MVSIAGVGLRSGVVTANKFVTVWLLLLLTAVAFAWLGQAGATHAFGTKLVTVLRLLLLAVGAFCLVVRGASTTTDVVACNIGVLLQMLVERSHLSWRILVARDTFAGAVVCLFRFTGGSIEGSDWKLSKSSPMP